MEQLRRKYAEKSAEMREKWADVINEICCVKGVDTGVGFEMLKAVARGADYADNIPFDKAELQKDYFELLEISNMIAFG